MIRELKKVFSNCAYVALIGLLPLTAAAANNDNGEDNPKPSGTLTVSPNATLSSFDDVLDFSSYSNQSKTSATSLTQQNAYIGSYRGGRNNKSRSILDITIAVNAGTRITSLAIAEGIRNNGALVPAFRRQVATALTGVEVGINFLNDNARFNFDHNFNTFLNSQEQLKHRSTDISLMWTPALNDNTQILVGASYSILSNRYENPGVKDQIESYLSISDTPPTIDFGSVSGSGAVLGIEFFGPFRDYHDTYFRLSTTFTASFAGKESRFEDFDYYLRRGDAGFGATFKAALTNVETNCSWGVKFGLKPGTQYINGSKSQRGLNGYGVVFAGFNVSGN